MKIAIFENQYYQVQRQFNVANRIFYNDRLEYSQFNSSNEFGSIHQILDYDLVIIDISLSTNSDLDGFDLIEEILKIEDHPKILILTANSKIEENIEERGLPKIPILMKPVDFKDIYNKIEEIKITPKEQNTL